MIPATSITDFDADGRAWVVVPDEMYGFTLAVEHWMEHDRPCDTCPPSGVVSLHDGLDLCPDCGGSGRHTFDIEVEQSTDPIVAQIVRQKYGPKMLRLSVVPGMVLPIVENPRDANGLPHIVRRQIWQGDHWHYTFMLNDGSAVRSITLPPDAAPGTHWAIQVQRVE